MQPIDTTNVYFAFLMELKAIPERAFPSRLRLWLDGLEVGRLAERWVTHDLAASWRGELYRLAPCLPGTGEGFVMWGPDENSLWEVRPVRHFKRYWDIAKPSGGQRWQLVPVGWFRRRWELRQRGHVMAELSPRGGRHRGWVVRSGQAPLDAQWLLLLGFMGHAMGLGQDSGFSLRQRLHTQWEKRFELKESHQGDPAFPSSDP
ncbi:MAG: hypothetical protein V3V20_07895 [Algisphaera sp.]